MMDLIEGILESIERDVTFMVVDRLGKYAHFTNVAHLLTTIVISHVFMNY